MAHDIEVQKIVLLPRFTSFSGARSFLSAPINVRAFASAIVTVWVADGVGTSPTFAMSLQESPDLKIWTALSGFSPTPGVELTQSVPFKKEWVRVSVVLTGSNPAFTGWAVGDFVTRAHRN
jgi:hypothetical protein